MVDHRHCGSPLEDMGWPGSMTYWSTLVTGGSGQETKG